MSELSSIDEVLTSLGQRLNALAPVTIGGRVERVAGTVVRARVPRARVGDLCLLRCPDAGWKRPAEVVGIDAGIAMLAPFGELDGISDRTEVEITNEKYCIDVGNGLLGQVLDGFGRLWGHGTATHPLTNKRAVDAGAPDPLSRDLVAKPMAVGVRAVDALMTCAEGQRIGIFAAAGAGKTTLMSMLVNGTEADVCVVALIGERGREVREFVEHELGKEGRLKSVLVVATSDRPAMERLKAGFVATTIAEYFRDQGKRVLLLMDSVTRLARAQREIGLAAGELPARQGFPPSMFAMLPRLFERAGPGSGGSITAFYTVLVEGDDLTEPVADEVRSLLDGHIVLSRALSAKGHYPAIDVLASLSRVMQRVVSAQHTALAEKLRTLLAKYEEVELLVRIGEYQKGTDPLADEAILKIDKIRTFLKQPRQESVPFDAMLKALQTCLR